MSETKPEPKFTVAGVGNVYGNLAFRLNHDHEPEWSVENYDGYQWHPCPQGVFDALVDQYGLDLA